MQQTLTQMFKKCSHNKRVKFLLPKIKIHKKHTAASHTLYELSQKELKDRIRSKKKKIYIVSTRIPYTIKRKYIKKRKKIIKRKYIKKRKKIKCYKMTKYYLLKT